MSPKTPETNDKPEVPATDAPVVEVKPTVAPVATTSSTPTPSSNKKLILIASIVGGAVLLAVIGIFVFIALTSVSKQDYANAAEQYNEVNSANSALVRSASSLSNSTSDSDAEFNKALKTAEEAVTTLKTENEEFGKLKAVSVGEGKDLYKTFDDKLEAYIVYGNDLISSVKTLRPALVTCDEVSEAATDARVQALKDCADALGKVNDIPNAEFKKFIGAMKDGYSSYETTYEKMSALTSPYGAQYEEYKVLRDKMYDVQKDIRTATTNFTKEVKERDDAMSVKDSADALRKFLNEKQRS